MPLGILHEVEFATIEGSVCAGDVAVVLSDGAAECGSDLIRQVIFKYEDKPANEIAEKIVEAAKNKSGDRHDDLSAVVCIFS